MTRIAAPRTIAETKTPLETLEEPDVPAGKLVDWAEELNPDVPLANPDVPLANPDVPLADPGAPEETEPSNGIISFWNPLGISLYTRDTQTTENSLEDWVFIAKIGSRDRKGWLTQR